MLKEKLITILVLMLLDYTKGVKEIIYALDVSKDT
jgi:hypothetical protein